jgi:hypothetical protein
MVELDRWVVRLSGAPEETISRTSSESFSTDKLGNDQWTRLASTDEASYPGHDVVIVRVSDQI